MYFIDNWKKWICLVINTGIGTFCSAELLPVNQLYRTRICISQPMTITNCISMACL